MPRSRQRRDDHGLLASSSCRSTATTASSPSGRARPVRCWSSARGTVARTHAEPAASPQIVPPIDLQKEADRLILGRYAPAAVLINDAFEILQFRGKTSPYLEAAPGAASFNILKMAREGLLVELRSSILKARRAGRPRAQGGTPGPAGRPRSRDVNLEIVPMKQGGERPLSLPRPLRGGGRKAEGRSRPASGSQAEARRPCRTRQHRQARTGADGDQGLPAGDHRGAGGFERGAQERQRRDPFRERRAPVDQRGARDRQGGAPVRPTKS